MVSTIIVGVCAVAVLVSLIVIHHYRKKESVKCTEPVQAICTGVYPEINRSVYDIRVGFDYSYNGRPYKNVRSFDYKRIALTSEKKAMAATDFEEDKEYTIYVNPDQPEVFLAFRQE